VTITKVTANISATANASDPGWVTLVDSTNSPQQLDLLTLESPTCILISLGSKSGLPPGFYRQIRLYLLANDAASGPAPNQCGTGNGFNCVVPHGANAQELFLSGNAQAGIPIFTSQIAGNGINLTSGQATDINISFDSCASVLLQSNGQYQLNPALRAAEVAATNNSIGGKVVDGSNQTPIGGAVILLEQSGASGIDRVVDAGVSASDGTFLFCPLPSGSYDVVVDALAPGLGVSTKVYGATITFNVPLGTQLTTIPLTSEGSGTGTLTPWSTITGQVTTAGPGGATLANVTLLALQRATPIAGTPVLVTVPIFSTNAQPPTITTEAAPASGPACPLMTDCSNFSLTVPSGNPTVGTFTNGSATYAPPLAGNVNYTLIAESVDCTASVPNPATVSDFTVSLATTTALGSFAAFSGCVAPF
jgi:hypothetical protein